MREEIKPCPFCGKQGIIQTRYDEMTGNPLLYFVQCSLGCQAKAGCSIESKNDAINIWNRRI
jgi:Lar family restriction alleviation protein